MRAGAAGGVNNLLCARCHQKQAWWIITVFDNIVPIDAEPAGYYCHSCKLDVPAALLFTCTMMGHKLWAKDTHT